MDKWGVGEWVVCIWHDILDVSGWHSIEEIATVEEKFVTTGTLTANTHDYVVISRDVSINDGKVLGGSIKIWWDNVDNLEYID